MESTDFREFIERAAEIVCSFGGSLSGEHGDGQSRAALLPKMFGPELIQAFREFKTLWDPDNRMNPGKLSDAVRVYDPAENLRHASRHDLRGCNSPRRVLETHFVFARDNGSLERAAERCVGVGSCRNTQGGVMCPSYRATGEEQHSTRGRAHLLWEMLAGALRDEGFQSHAVHEALDLCLSCKACKTECPVQVDMAAYKSEFLAQHYKGRLHPLHHYIFGFADRLARYGSLAPALTNAMLTGPLTSPLIKRIAGVAQERQLPRLAPKSYQKTRDRSADLRAKPSRSLPQRSRSCSGPTPGTTTTTRNRSPRPKPSSPQAGFQVETPQGHICCGRPLYDFGLLSAARSYLAKVLRRMAPQIEAGLPFIFLEPSCASVFKDELLELFPNDPRAQRLSQQVWLLADLLAAKAPDFASSPTGRLEGAHILAPRPLPSQSRLRRPGKRNRAPAPGRRHGRAHPGRLLRHGRPLRLRSR